MTDNAQTARLSRMSSTVGAPDRVCGIVFDPAGPQLVAITPSIPVVIGREAPSDVIVASASLSRQHAKLELVDGQLWLEDLRSTNGCTVNGVPITRARVGAGDEVALGAIRVSFHQPLAPQVEPERVCSHEALRRWLIGEASRATFFRRPLALLMVRPRRALERVEVEAWSSAIVAQLRRVDRAAWFGGDTLEVALPELDEPGVHALAARLAAIAPGAQMGAAILPASAGSVEELRSAALAALRTTGEGAPLTMAAVRSAPARVTAVDGELVARSPPMRALAETVRRVANSPIAALLIGETGAGKEVVARLLHAAGPRRARAMITVNCGALPVHLVESTLFGHEKHSFTDARESRPGMFEVAHGGTVFLDEIGELSLSAQVSLLRVVETKRVMRVGATEERPADARVVAATHRDLEAMCHAGTFRWDLYYRLNGMTLTIPPLRERAEDLPVLRDQILAQLGAGDRRFTATAEAALAAYSWPGNVRELRNVIEQALVMAGDGAIGVEALPARVRGGLPALTASAVAAVPAPIDLREALRLHEITLITAALERAQWKRAVAARALGLPVRTLFHRMQLLGITAPGEDD